MFPLTFNFRVSICFYPFVWWVSYVSTYLDLWKTPWLRCSPRLRGAPSPAPSVTQWSKLLAPFATQPGSWKISSSSERLHGASSSSWLPGDEGPGKPRRRLGGMGADGSETDGLKKFSLGHGRLALSNDLSGKELCSRPQEAIEHHLLGGGRGHREAVKNPRNPLWWRGSSNAIIEDFQSVSPICLKGLPSKDIPQNPEVIFWCCMPGSSWCRKKWEVQI